MKSKGLTADVQPGAGKMAGEVLGNVLPVVGAAKAPQIASSMLQAGRNAMAPATMNKQAGMALFDTSNLPNRGRDLIQSKAEELANQLKNNGFSVDVQHSGSAAGPSSYLKIYDPKTGKYFINDVRLSGHSKGVFNSQGVTNVSSDEEIANILQSALKMRDFGKSSGMLYQESLDKEATKLIDQGMKPKSAYNKAREMLGQ